MFDFANFKDTELHDEALCVDNLVKLYEEQEISKDELLELLDDLNRTQLIECQAEDIELKANLMRAIEIIVKIA